VIWALDAPDQSTQESKQHKRLSVIKSNLDKIPEPVGVVIGSDGITFGEAPAAPRVETTLDRAKELILTLLSDEPVRATTIEEECKQAGISWRSAQNAKKNLKITSVKMDDGWYWSLPVKGQYEK
jgi:hypothetical protein